MARITVEDCLQHIENRFLMTVVAILRARQLLAGSKPVLQRAEKHKPVVAALREIAAGLITWSKSSPKDGAKNASKVLEDVFKGLA
ncbi:MAG: DNA-directed RNA polymerase subunit omega [Deltaproteobacteria bacterium]|nr:DNA-directed RNA polymerase subunit omega [Deltaproteobacteria bacterium]